MLVSKSREVPDEEAQRKADEEREAKIAEKAAEKEAAKAAKEAEKAEKLAKGESVEEEEEELEVNDEDDSAEKKDEKPKMKTEQYTDFERVNDVKAIWTRAAKDISASEYNDFFKTLTKDETAPLQKIHFTAEGEITFRSILYVPKK